MTQVIVTVLYEKQKPLDLSLPWEVPIGMLAEGIAQVYAIRTGPRTNFGLANLKGETIAHLANDETLADANVIYGDRLKLLVFGSPYILTATGTKIPIDRDYTSIGRSTPGARVDIDLTDLDENKAVSRQHAAVEFHNDSYYLKDTNSSNGVWVNNLKLAPMQPRKLKNGDVMVFGGSHGVELIFGIKE